MKKSVHSHLRQTFAAFALLATQFAWASPQPAPRPACPPAAVQPSTAQVAEGMRQARERGFLWRITKDGRTSYLYGTIHVAKADWVYPGPKLTQAVAASDVIALELDLLDPETIRRMKAGIAAAPRAALPPELTQRLLAQAAKECLPEATIRSLPPELLMSTLISMSGRRDGLYSDYAIDAVYAGLAHSVKKPVQALETPELQLKLLLGRSKDETATIVEEGLQGMEGPALRGILLRMGNMWAESRYDELARYEEWCECAQTPFNRAMLMRTLDDRNPGMADKIDALHKRGQRVFAAVGSLHMIGANGLPKLMTQRGYQVERVDFRR